MINQDKRTPKGSPLSRQTRPIDLLHSRQNTVALPSPTLVHAAANSSAAGATPNEITSASESNSRPSAACLRRHRARRPSSASKTKKRLRFDLNSCRPRPAKAGKARSTHISTPRAGLLRSAWGSLASINTLASQCSGTWKTTRPFDRPPAANQLRRALSQIPEDSEMYVEPVVRTRRTILWRAN